MILAAVLAATSLGALAQDKVAYHVNDAKATALATLRNIRNHLDTDPTAQITLVTHADGVDFLMEGAMDRNGSPYAATVAALVNRGVKFEVCEITLKNRSLKKEQFIQEANFTPSGVVRLTKLQLQGFAYIKP
jgi:intracellular sulfur oxidation DsrE/DsrF family protein